MTMDSGMLLDSLKTYMMDERVLIGMTAAAAGMSVKLLSKKPNSPPGPPVWPIVGSLPSIKNDVSGFSELAEKYGDIYFLQMGLFCQVPTVVLNNMELLREALLQKQDDFAGRQRTETFDIISLNGQDIIFGDNNPTWRYQRKIAHVALRKYAAGYHFQELLERNVELVSDMIRKVGDEPQDVLLASSLIFYNIVASFCFGKKYDMKDPEFLRIKELFDVSIGLFTGPFLADIIPGFKYIPTPAMNLLRNIMNELHNFFKTTMNEHRKNFDENDLRDLTDYIIHSEQEMKKSGLEEYQVKLDDVHTRQILLDMFSAGTDTSRNTLTWMMLMLAANPDIQKKAQKEIDQNIGRETKINGQNRSKIPFCEAILYETLRLRSPAPVALPHRATCDTSLGGYDIPKDTQIFLNLRGIHIDPREWENPEVFNPSRFMDDHGNLAPKPNAFLPFSTGRRSCVGESMAKSGLHIIIGSLLQRFSFYPPEGVMLDLNPKASLLFALPNETKLVVKER